MGEVIGKKPLVERQEDGRRKMQRSFGVLSRGREIWVEEDFVSDYSSIPMILLVLSLVIYAMTFTHLEETYRPLIFLCLLLVPRFSAVDIAGIVHDWLYKTGELSKWQADLIWLDLAKSGEHCANVAQAYVCWFVGLVICGWPAYLMHRFNNGFRSIR